MRPDAGATAVSVGGMEGRDTEENGMVSVVLPLSSGQTMFFSGDDTPGAMQHLAANLLAHLEQALPPAPLPAGYDPTVWC